MDENAKQKLRKLVADVLGLAESDVTQSFSYRDTDRWDSLKHMEIITALEQNFSVTLTVDEIIAMISIPDITRILDSKIAGGSDGTKR